MATEAWEDCVEGRRPRRQPWERTTGSDPVGQGRGPPEQTQKEEPGRYKRKSGGSNVTDPREERTSPRQGNILRAARVSGGPRAEKGLPDGAAPRQSVTPARAVHAGLSHTAAWGQWRQCPTYPVAKGSGEMCVQGSLFQNRVRRHYLQGLQTS